MTNPLPQPTAPPAGMFALGLGEPEEFAARLQDEHAALEAANVYGLLESGPLVRCCRAGLGGGGCWLRVLGGEG